MIVNVLWFLSSWDRIPLRIDDTTAPVWGRDIYIHIESNIKVCTVRPKAFKESRQLSEVHP